MPSVPKRIPKYRRHTSGQARVTLNNRDFLLGTFGSKESRQAYDRLVAEWLQTRTLPRTVNATFSINELILAYWNYATAYYGFDKQQRGDAYALRDALRVVQSLYGDVAARQFGPLALKACRSAMIDKGWSRSYINAQVDRIRRMFRWAAEEELLPGSIYQNIRAVRSLTRGKTDARESDPVRPVATEVIEATLPHLQLTVRAMVLVQLITGCRPAEVCLLRPMDLDMRNPLCWVYTPGSDAGAHGQHKTAHHGHDRRILIGPRAQDVLRPFLGVRLEAFCFCPANSEAQRNLNRKQSIRGEAPTLGNKRGRPRKRRRRSPGNRYDTHSYRRAIARACAFAFPPPGDLAKREAETKKEWHARLTFEQRVVLRKWRQDHTWAPNQLRHTRATELRPHGLDVTKTILGHSKIETTQLYAEKDLAAAVQLVSKHG